MDPGGRTIRSLSGTGPAPIPPASEEPIDQKLKTQVRQDFADVGKPSEFDEFWKAVMESHAAIKQFLRYAGQLNNTRQVVQFWLKLREMGAPARELKQVLELVVLKSKTPRWTYDFVNFLAGNESPIARTFKKTAPFIKYVLVVIEYVDHAKKGDYHMAVVLIYKEFMSEMFPWAGWVKSIQDFAEKSGLVPPSAKQTTLFRLIRSIDPIGLGAGGVDAVCVLVPMVIVGKIDEKRVSRLAERLKGGATGIYYQGGENVASWWAGLADMGDGDFEVFLRDVERHGAVQSKEFVEWVAGFASPSLRDQVTRWLYG